MIDLDQLTRVLSPKQIRSIVEAQARINVWEGAVRSGKTISSLLAWLIFVADAPPGLLLVTGRTKDTIARNVFGPLKDPELFGDLAGHVRYTRGAPTATILGRTIEVVGANDAQAEPKARGQTLVGAYLDEATILPEDFFIQLLARLSVPGARLFATTNPDAPAHWLRKGFLKRAAELRLATWHFTLDDNPALDPSYVEALKAEYTGLWYQRFILGRWIMAEGAIYDMWDEDRHVVTGLPEMGRRWWVGVDYGTSNPFAALLLGTGTDPGDGVERLYVADEWRWDSATAMRQLTDHDYSQRLRAWLATAGARVLGQPDTPIMPTWVAVDPSAASFKVQLRRDRVAGVIDADNDVLAGIRVVSSLLGTDRLRVHERCEGLVEEIPGYVWDPDKADLGEDVPIKLDDHSLDALRYGAMAARPAWGRWLRTVPEAEREAA